MLSNIRHYVSLNMCRMVYFGIFHSLLTYSCQIWGQVPTPNIKRILILQNKALCIINFAPFRSQVNPLYKINNILKIADIVQLQFFYLLMIISIINYQLLLTLSLLMWEMYTHMKLQGRKSTKPVYPVPVIKLMVLTVSNTKP